MYGALGITLEEEKLLIGSDLKKYSIYMLQEVHCSQENSHLWATEWGYKSVFSSFSSSKAGVSILFNNNFDLQIMKT